MTKEQRLEKEWVWFLHDLYKSVNKPIWIYEINLRDNELRVSNWTSPDKMMENLRILENEFWIPRMQEYMRWYASKINK